MWVKNLEVFVVTGADPTTWGDAFAQHPLRDPEPSQRRTFGFVQPPDCQGFVDRSDDFYAFVVGMASRKLQGQAVAREVERRLSAIKRDEPPTKQERERVRDDVEAEFLSRTPVVEDHTPAVYCHRTKLLYVLGNNRAGGEALQMAVRRALGSFMITPMRPRVPVPMLLAEWVRNAAPAGWEIGDNMVLRAEGGASTVFKKQPLRTETVVQHLDDGATVKQLELYWRDTLRFELTQEGELLKVGPLDCKMRPAEAFGIWPEIMAALPDLVADVAKVLQAPLDPEEVDSDAAAEADRAALRALAQKSQGSTRREQAPFSAPSEPDKGATMESEADAVARAALAAALGGLAGGGSAEERPARGEASPAGGFVPIVLPTADAPPDRVRDLLNRLAGQQALAGLVVVRRHSDAYRAIYTWANERALPVTLVDEAGVSNAFPAQANAAVCDMRDPLAKRVAAAALQRGVRVMRLQPPR